jgi:N2227-like protein
MNLAFRFLLSPETTPVKNEHVLRPYAHWFSHQRNNDTLFRAVTFPDAVPRMTSNFHLAETDFLSLPVPAHDTTPFWSTSKLSQVSNKKLLGYDYIVTLFFIDTSLNVFATMEHIYALLRPGGTWINLGPLLWTSGGPAKLELSLDEVLLAAEEIGFMFKDRRDDETMARKTIECEYTSDTQAMMRWTYKTEFWVATKSK